MELEKAVMKVRTILWIGVILLASTSCEKFFHDRSGEAVSFSASADKKGFLTKTSFSGEVVSGKERINWSEGDQVKVFMYTHDNGNRWGNNAITAEDYSIVNIQTQGQKSVGQLSATDSNLEWIEGRVHDFYSVYPANYSGFDSGVLNKNNIWIWGNSGMLTFTLPCDQNGEVSGGNMEHLFMAAVSEGNATSGKGSVALEYYPQVTTLHFTFRNNFSSQEPVTLSQIKLSSIDHNVPLTGTYTSSVVNGRFVPSTSGNIQNSSLTINLSVSATVAYGETADFVFFLLPHNSYDPKKLELTVTTSKGKSSISLENSQVQSFNACLKYNLNLHLDENAEPALDVSEGTQLLAAVSNVFMDPPILDNVEYLYYTDPPGMYYKNTWPPQPISDADMKTIINGVTTIDNSSISTYNHLLTHITPEDFTIFPNLTSIHLSNLGNTETIDVENLNNMLELAFSGNPTQVTISNCTFDPDNALPLTLNATNTMNINISNLTGLKEINLVAGDKNNGGGNIGNVVVSDCPDLKVIKVMRYNHGGQVAMQTGTFSGLPELETIYLDQINQTTTISITDCSILKRVIIANQTNWLLSRIELADLPQLGDSAQDNSEYGLTGLNVDCVSLNIDASKKNCPLLGPTFKARQSAPDSNARIDIPFRVVE